jgi:SagB-type dehydrogenase family enzyme
MYKKCLVLLISLLILFGIVALNLKTRNMKPPITLIALPAPIYKSETSIEEALKWRRSIREFKGESITLQQISQLLWAAQGITSANGFRTAPSAGALYPLEIYLVSGNVTSLPAGVYHYSPVNHALELFIMGDKRRDLCRAAQKQVSVEQGAADIVIAANYKKTTVKYGSRGKRYVDMEAGHVAENVSLQLVSLRLGTVTIGAFDDSAVKSVLNLPHGEEPLYIMPIGKFVGSLFHS